METDPADRLWACLAHLAGLVPGIGPALTALLWSLLRRRSEYLSFQALQSLALQLLFRLLMILGGYLLSILVLGFSVLLVFQAAGGKDIAAGTFMWIYWAVMVLPWVLFIAIALGYLLLVLIGSIVCACGQPWRIPGLGGWMQSVMQPGQVEASLAG